MSVLVLHHTMGVGVGVVRRIVTLVIHWVVVVRRIVTLVIHWVVVVRRIPLVFDPSGITTRAP